MAVGVRLHTNLQQREQAVWTSKIRYQIKQFSIGCVGRFKPLGSLNSLLSYVPQLCGPNPVSLFTLSSGSCGRWLLLVFPQLLSNHHGGWITMAVAASAGLSFGSPHSHLEARNCWWLWHFLFIDLAVEIFISQYPLISNTLLLHALPPPVPGNYYSILYSMSLTLFDTSYKGIHVVLVRLFLAYFSWHNVFQVSSCCVLGQDFLLFKKE